MDMRDTRYARESQYRHYQNTTVTYLKAPHKIRALENGDLSAPTPHNSFQNNRNRIPFLYSSTISKLVEELANDQMSGYMGKRNVLNEFRTDLDRSGLVHPIYS